MPSLLSRRGFSLIEVLVALVVFSLGLIGVAGLLVMSTQANHGAFIRTQATFLAQNMADRMRANPIGMWRDLYHGNYPVAAASSGATTCTATSPCSPVQVATRDKQQWSIMLKQLLPDDNNLKSTNITCSGATTSLTGGVPSFYAKRAPYDGICTMKITWTERSLAIGVAPSAQTFAWTFQP